MEQIEIRVLDDGKIEISGYVNAVERDSKILTDNSGKKFIEKVKQGAFKRAIEKRNNIELKTNHKKVIGSTKENLELKEDPIGLYAKAIVDDPETIEKAKEGKLKGWSFGFTPLKEEWEEIKNLTVQHRDLLDIDLHEVSILTDCEPAYYATTIEMRNSNNEQLEIRALPVEMCNIIIEQSKKQKPDITVFEAELEILKIKKEK